MTIFFPKRKKHVKFERMIKRDLFKVCSIASYTFFPSFGQFVDTTPIKIFPFCREPFIEPFFHIFRTNQSAAQQVRDPSMQTSDNRKEPSLVSKPHGVEPSWVLPTCPELVLPYVMEHCHGKKWLCIASFGNSYSGRFLSNERFKSINCCW